MPFIETRDGNDIYCKDWGKGPVVTFSHGWPLIAGFRVIAHDRRGHGRSSQSWDGNETDTYADDLAGATLKVYPKGSHGLATQNKDELNADLLAFIKG
jgi:non-heme chloroperoxidase